MGLTEVAITKMGIAMEMEIGLEMVIAYTVMVLSSNVTTNHSTNSQGGYHVLSLCYGRHPQHTQKCLNPAKPGPPPLSG